MLPQAQGQAAERATLVRQFNCPTHLGQARVRLKLDIDAATVRATLNGKPLTVPSHDTPWRIDVTEHLRLHNQLEIAVDATSRLPHRWDVALEIIQPTSSRDGP